MSLSFLEMNQKLNRFGVEACQHIEERYALQRTILNSKALRRKIEDSRIKTRAASSHWKKYGIRIAKLLSILHTTNKLLINYNKQHVS